MTAQRRYELTDDEWERIKGYFPEREAGQKGRPRNEDRPILNGILWIVRSGAAWRDLPERYGAWSTVYSRFVQWQEEGLFDAILKDLSEETDFQDMSIDKGPSGQCRCKKGAVDSEYNQHIGLSRGGKTTKIHAIVDALGNPIHIHLSAGNLHDSTEAQAALSEVPLERGFILADKAYGTTDIRTFIENSGGNYCIPLKSNAVNPWDCDWYLYKERHLVECFFQKLKMFRRIATRYEKLAKRFLAIVQLGCIMIWLA